MTKLFLLISTFAALFLIASDYKIRFFRIILLYLFTINTIPAVTSVGGMQLAYVDALFWSILALFLFAHLLWQDGRFLATPIDAWAVVFLGLNLIVIGFSVTRGNILANAVREFACYLRIPVATFIFVNMLSSKDELEQLVRAVMIFCAVVCIIGIGQALFLRASYYDPKYGITVRVFSTFGNPNVYGGYLEVIFMIILSAFLESVETRQRRLVQLVRLTLLILATVNVVLTYSRGTFLAVSLTAGVLLLRRGYWRALSFIAIVVLCLFLTDAAESFSHLLQRQLSVVSSTRDIVTEHTIAHRIAQYLNYVSIIRRHPFVGIGWGVAELPTFFVDLVRTQRLLFNFGGLNSVYFDLSTKSGIPSMTVFVGMIMSLVLFLYRSIPSLPRGTLRRAATEGLAYGIPCLMLHQTMDNLMKWPQLGYFLGILAAIAIRSYQLASNDSVYYAVSCTSYVSSKRHHYGVSKAQCEY